MPVHDWSRVNAGIFHDFHSTWIVEIKRILNGGLLPSGYYALGEQVAGNIGPDVLTLQSDDTPDVSAETSNGFQGGTEVSLAPPKARFIATRELDIYARRQRTLVIRHSGGDRVVALIEIVSPGNKSSRQALQAFLDKAVGAICQGYHFLLMDLIPPRSLDPSGIHGAIWNEFDDAGYVAPPDKPLTVASYSAGERVTAYVNPIAVGDTLPEMPLFLSPDRYVQVPLESTYNSAWLSVPARWREVLESSHS